MSASRACTNRSVAESSCIFGGFLPPWQVFFEPPVFSFAPDACVGQKRPGGHQGLPGYTHPHHPVVQQQQGERWCCVVCTVAVAVAAAASAAAATPAAVVVRARSLIYDDAFLSSACATLRTGICYCDCRTGTSRVLIFTRFCPARCNTWTE